jgi:hypothetical protein
MARGPGLACAAVLTAAGLGLVACTGPAAGQRDAAAPRSPAPAPPAAPAVVRSCWVPASTGNVSLADEQAKALTTRAAQLGRDGRRGQRVARRLATAVQATTRTDDGTAAEVAAGLAGLPKAPRLVCAFARTTPEPQDPGPSGLVPRARRLRAAWTQVFGPLVAGGFARGGVSTGHVDGSAHYEGRAIDVFFRPLGDAEQRRRGWVFAQWLVAHAADHHVLSVIYDDRIWTSWASGAWRDYVHPGATFADRGNAILRHKDHVHVAVESGRPYRPASPGP